MARPAVRVEVGTCAHFGAAALSVWIDEPRLIGREAEPREGVELMSGGIWSDTGELERGESRGAVVPKAVTANALDAAEEAPFLRERTTGRGGIFDRKQNFVAAGRHQFRVGLRIIPAVAVRGHLRAVVV